jgi:P4 family phage/plasmid primase-like protien
MLNSSHARLQTFLASRRNRGKPSDASMTGLADGSKGSWYIPDSEYKMFMDLMNAYHFEYEKGTAPPPPLAYAEQPIVNSHKPLLIDLDFQYPKNDRSVHHSFTQEMIEEFCKVLVQGIQTFFDLSEYPELKFFVLLRPQAYPSGDKMKDGIHIECPDFTLSNEKWNVLRQWVLCNGAIQRIFGSTRYMNLENNIFDPSMGRKQGWMFYGCSKPNIAPYELAYIKVYDPDMNVWTHDDGKSYSTRDLLEMLSIRYNVIEECGNVRPEKKEEYDRLFALSQSRDGGGRGSPSLAPTTGVAPAPLDLDPVQQTVRETLLSLLPNADDERTLIRRLVLECLSKERCDDHDGWVRVGWCLHNIEPSEDMFNLWMDFSKKSEKWEDHRNREMPQLRRDWFRSMRKEGDGPRLTDKSLHKWAREDNREQYDIIMNEDIIEYIVKYVDDSHYHIAKLMEKMFQATFKASFGLRTTEWYQYDEILNMWKHMNQGIDIKKKICFDVSGKVDQAIQRMRNRLAQARTQDETDRVLKKMESIGKVQLKLFNVTFIESVTKMAGLFFAEEDFTKKLNMNPYLVGFANGILELRYKETPTSQTRTLFRQGRPEDYVSFLAGRNESETDAIEYHPYDPNDPLIPEIMDFFSKLFPNPELRKYVLKLMASCLEGANPEQCYYIFTGRGSNGKSKLVELMRLTLGDYITSIQSTVLTRKRPDSGAANPDVIVTKCKRFIYMQEPDAKEPLNTSRMKQFSGEDMVEARGLFQDQEKFKIMGKLFMMCNDLPPIYSMDNGTWRRIRVVPFESTFRSAEHPDWKSGRANIYLKDEFLDIKLREWRQSFLSLLVHIYETEYLVHGLHPEPAVVLRASDSYKESFDVFAKFCNERIRREDQNRVDFKDLKRVFQIWRKDNAIKANLSDGELWNRCLDSSEIGKLDPTGKKQIMMHIRIFSTDEEVESFEQRKNGVIEEGEEEEEED